MTQHDVRHDECSVETATTIYLLTTQFTSPVIITAYVLLQITFTERRPYTSKRTLLTVKSE